MKKISFITKEDESSTIAISDDEISEIIPDADMRFSLIILKDGNKHFVQGSKFEIQERLAATLPTL